jgi:hypothetical protein
MVKPATAKILLWPLPNHLGEIQHSTRCGQQKDTDSKAISAPSIVYTSSGSQKLGNVLGSRSGKMKKS